MKLETKVQIMWWIVIIIPLLFFAFAVISGFARMGENPETKTEN